MPAGQSRDGVHSVVTAALYLDAERVKTSRLGGRKPSAPDLQEAILGCVLKATGTPYWQGSFLQTWKPHERLQEQLTWCYQCLPGPSPGQLQVLQELVQHAGKAAGKGLGYTALQMAAASGSAPLLQVLLQQPTPSSTAGAGSKATQQQEDAGRATRSPPYLRLMHPPSSSSISSSISSSQSRLLVLPPAVGLIEKPQKHDEESGMLKYAEDVDGILPGPLELAAASGSAEAVKVLLAAGYSVHGLSGDKDPEQLSPVHWAAACLAPEVVQLLLQEGADASAVYAPTGQTPLHLAAAPWSRSEDSSQFSAFDEQTLAQSPDLEMQQRVLMQLGAAGASSDVKDARGETPLMSALVSNNRLGAISLLAAGAQVPPGPWTLRGQHIPDVVEWKLRYHDPDLVLVLLAAGAEWQPESPESCQSMVQRMSEGVWQEDDLDKQLRNWVCIATQMLLAECAGWPQQQQQVLRRLLQTLRLTYPAFCSWFDAPAAFGDPTEVCSMHAAWAEAAVGYYEIVCGIHAALQQPSNVEQLLLKTNQGVLLRILKNAAAQHRCLAAAESSSNSSSSGAGDATSSPSQASSSSTGAAGWEQAARKLASQTAATTTSYMLPHWPAVQPVLMDITEWATSASGTPLAVAAPAATPAASSSDSSSGCMGKDGSKVPHLSNSSSTSSSSSSTQLADLMPVWGYGTQPRTPDGRPYQPDLAAVRACMKAGKGLDGFTADGVSVWQAAVVLGDPGLLEALVSCPKHLTAELRQQWQHALRHALLLNWTPVAPLLLQTGAHIMSDEMYEAWNTDLTAGMEGSVDRWLAAGVDVNAGYGPDGDAALHAMARAGGSWEITELQGKYVNICEMLLAHDADLEGRNAHGCTPLLIALSSGAFRMAQLLLDEGAHAHTDAHGLTVWDLVCEQLAVGFSTGMELLLARGLAPTGGLPALARKLAAAPESPWEVPGAAQRLRRLVLEVWLHDVPMASNERKRKQREVAAQLQRSAQGYKGGTARRKQQAGAGGDADEGAAAELQAAKEAHAEAVAAQLLLEEEMAAAKAAQKAAKKQRQAAAKKAAAALKDAAAGEAGAAGSESAATADAGASRQAANPQQQQQQEEEEEVRAGPPPVAASAAPLAKGVPTELLGAVLEVAGVAIDAISVSGTSTSEGVACVTAATTGQNSRSTSGCGGSSSSSRGSGDASRSGSRRDSVARTASPDVVASAQRDQTASKGAGVDKTGQTVRKGAAPGHPQGTQQTGSTTVAGSSVRGAEGSQQRQQQQVRGASQTGQQPQPQQQQQQQHRQPAAGDRQPRTSLTSGLSAPPAPQAPAMAAGGVGVPPPAVQLPGAMGLLLSRAAAVAHSPEADSRDSSGQAGGMRVTPAASVVVPPTASGTAALPSAAAAAPHPSSSSGSGSSRKSRAPAKSSTGSSSCKPRLARECVVCWEEEPCVLLLPCRHLCCCEGCSQALQAAGKQCPMCRAAVEQHISVFF